jgi:hypothetical protein
MGFTSVSIPPQHTWSEYYAGLLMCLLAPISTTVAFSAAVISVPPLALVCLVIPPQPTLSIDRSTWRFRILSGLTILSSIPLVVLVSGWLTIALGFIFVATAPVCLFRWNETRKSWAALQSYRGRWYINFLDLICAMAGTIDRQGFCETWASIPMTIVLVPLYKYLFFTNPFLHTLGLSHVNQWSDEFPHEPDFLYETLQSQICDAVLGLEQATETDSWTFSGYHQHGDGGAVVGVQFSNIFRHLRCMLLSETHHSCSPRSKMAYRNVITVKLSFWNPFYFLTGHVEVNTRTDNGVEHPMWLVVDQHSRTTAENLNSMGQLFHDLGIELRDYMALK